MWVKKDYGMKLNQYKMIVKVTPAKVHTIAWEANINKVKLFFQDSKYEISGIISTGPRKMAKKSCG